MKFLHKFFIIGLILFLSSETALISAEEKRFVVYDSSSSFGKVFASEKEALSFYEENRDSYNNLVLKDDERILMMEYGIIEFVRNDSCELMNYRSLTNGDTFLDPCKTGEALYIATDKDQVLFQIGGDVGSCEHDKLILHPFEEVTDRLSVYRIRDGRLLHDIRMRLEQDFFAVSLTVDAAPSFMEEGSDYYSYDGHYFYTDFYRLSDDVRNAVHEQAVNQQAYYNYFQYLPYRSLSNYDSEDLRYYLQEVLGFDGRLCSYEDYNGDGANDVVNRSELYGLEEEFLACQDLFGCNGLLLLAQAITESVYGKSLDAYEDGALFGVRPFDDQDGRYKKTADSLYAYSRYVISASFADHRKSDYSGTFFGDRASGIGSICSSDPYFGERCAAAAYRIDESLGFKDRNDCALALIEPAKRRYFYVDEHLDEIAFVLSDHKTLVFTVLSESEDAYKLQIDQSYDDDFFYDFRQRYAYIGKDEVSMILNEDKIGEKEMKEISLDLSGGDYHGFEKLTYDALYDQRAIPQKDGYEFSGYQDGIAQYREIKAVEVNRDPGTQISGRALDLRDLKMNITYADGEEKSVDVNRDLVQIEEENEKKKLVFSYCGVECKKNLSYADEEEFNDKMKGALKDENLSYIKANIRRYHEPLSFEEIFRFDLPLKEIDRRNYVIKDSTGRFDPSFDGLDLSLADHKSFIYTNDTYYVLLDEIKKEDFERISKIADGYGFRIHDGVNLSFRFNYQQIEAEGPFLFTLNIDDKKEDEVGSVYHLTAKGDVVKCKTTFSDHYLTFLARESGPYLLLSLKSENARRLPDRQGILNYSNMGFDNHRINIELFVALFLALSGIAGITAYYILENNKEKMWKDFRRSLREAAIVQEEKPKN